MADHTAEMIFVQLAYNESAQLLDSENFEALTARSEDGTVLPDVRLVHKPSGTTIDVSECNTQMQNMVIARIRMVRALAE